MTNGRVVMTQAAEISPHGMVYWPGNRDRQGLAARVMISRAKKNSFHPYMKIRIAAVKIPGAATGAM